MSVKALQEYTIYSRYARYLTDKKRRETWAEQVERVFQMHEKKFAKELENEEFRKYFEIAKDAVLKRKVLGSQRALQFGGEPIERHNEKIYNCSVTYIDRPRAFQEVMFLLLCGCGVGFSVQNIHVNKLPELRAINLGKDTATYKIPDSIEGWSEAIGILINSYFNNGLYPQYENRRVEFDYSLIRPEGSYISGGFKAPGPAGLERSIEKIRKIMEIASTEGKRLRPIHAYDILMHSSDAVLSGGVRRSATICLFSPDDEEMVKAKTGNWFIENAQRGRSNNSALLVRGKTNKADFMRLMESVKEFGEPGFVWAEDEGVCVNPCLSKDTIVFTSQGPRKIEDLIDLPFQALVNGKPFNSLKGFFKTGEQDLFVLKTKEGFEVELTKNHKVLLSSGEWVEAGQLSIGDKITIHQHNNEWSGFGNENEGWLVGSLLGDGCFSNGSAYLDYWGEAREEMMDIALDYIRENNLNYDTRTRGGEAVARVGKKRVQCKKLGELALEVGINEDKTISDSIYKTSSDFIKGFLGGWFDADGSVQGNLEKGISVRLSSAKLENLKVAQKLLLYFGIYSRVYSNRSEKQFRFMPDGKGGKKEYPCQALHELVIANDSILQFQNLIKFREKEKAIKLYELINSYKRTPNKTKFIGTFESLTYLKTDSVYDCTVEDIHAFDANGLYVHNCVEIGMYPVLLTDKEEFSGVQFCNLCEINGKKCKDLDSFLEACEAAAILGTMQAAYTDFPYLGEVTEDIVRKESLLGCSITGMMDNPVVLFNEENQRAGAKLIRDTNKKIASLLNINPAARTTCVKPAGTTSCVLGSSSGIHPHHAKRYFRRVQANRLEFPAQYFASKNPDAVEESVWSNNNTDVVLTFLCEVPVGGIVKNQVGAIDLLERVKLTQQNWVEYGTNKNLCVKPYLRHNVSNTITVKPEEWDEVANYIFENRKWFAGISLLPSSGDKDYPQAPFTTVYTASEIVKEYGEGSVFASGLIVDGLKAFDNNLWKACDFALGLRGNIELPAKPIEPDEPKKNGYTQKQYIDKLKKYANDLTEYSIKEAEYEVALEQINWIRRAKQFSDRYFEGDLRKATYCLKDVSNWKTWCDLKRTYVDIDWTEVVEEDEFFEEVSTMGAQACAGGSCEVSFN